MICQTPLENMSSEQAGTALHLFGIAHYTIHVAYSVLLYRLETEVTPVPLRRTLHTRIIRHYFSMLTSAPLLIAIILIFGLQVLAALRTGRQGGIFPLIYVTFASQRGPVRVELGKARPSAAPSSYIVQMRS